MRGHARPGPTGDATRGREARAMRHQVPAREYTREPSSATLTPTPSHNSALQHARPATHAERHALHIVHEVHEVHAPPLHASHRNRTPHARTAPHCTCCTAPTTRTALHCTHHTRCTRLTAHARPHAAHDYPWPHPPMAQVCNTHRPAPARVPSLQHAMPAPHPECAARRHAPHAPAPATQHPVTRPTVSARHIPWSALLGRPEIWRQRSKCSTVFAISSESKVRVSMQNFGCTSLELESSGVDRVQSLWRACVLNTRRHAVQCVRADGAL